MIHGKKISWSYRGKHPILNEVSFELHKGAITAFMGHSGAGKTTLLKCVAQLNAAYEGLITYDGCDMRHFDAKRRASTIGFVPQQYHLFCHLNVLDNCSYALIRVQGVEKKEAEEWAMKTLRSLGIDSLWRSYPSELSGGQQQRVAIARALVLRPEILLLDEPTSALDPDSKKSLERLLLQLKSQGITFALSSHDMPFLRRVMDHAYFLEQGQLVEEWDCRSDDAVMSEKMGRFLIDCA